MASRQRSIIHPDHFVVAPEMLGLPLASPSRRAYAMGIDLILAALLVKAGGLLLAFAAAAILFRASAPSARTGFVRRSVRTALQLAGAVILFLVILKGYHAISSKFQDNDSNSSQDEAAADDGNVHVNLSPGQLAGLAGPIMTMRRGEDSVQIANAAAAILNTMKAADASNSDMQDSRGGLIDLLGKHADARRIGAIDAAIQKMTAEKTPAQPSVPDSIVQRYLTASAHNDSATLKIYRDSLRQIVAGTEIRELEARNARLKTVDDSLRGVLKDSKQERGIRSAIAGFAVDDLGVGFGWFAVYFTAFLALWRGQTPGKRVAGIRVVRLDGEPLGWWMSFERFGGYAASFSVGLMGFLQILWDKNRQGLHDKACETVVVRITK